MNILVGTMSLSWFPVFIIFAIYYLSIKPSVEKKNVIKSLGKGHRRVFFSKFLMGGTQNFWSPSVPDGDEVGWGGGTCEKNLTEAETAHIMQN